MISYYYRSDGIGVFLEKRRVGTIKKIGDGFAYFPKGHSKPGEVFRTVAEIVYVYPDDRLDSLSFVVESAEHPPTEPGTMLPHETAEVLEVELAMKEGGAPCQS